MEYQVAHSLFCFPFSFYFQSGNTTLLWHMNGKLACCEALEMNSSLHVKQSQKCNLETLGHVSTPLFWNPSWETFHRGCEHLNHGRAPRIDAKQYKWDYICRLFDSEWSFGKYELSLLVCLLCANHTIYLVVLSQLLCIHVGKTSRFIFLVCMWI